jgi:Cu2+-exporting ATPase
MNSTEASGPFRAGDDIEGQCVAVCAHCSEALAGFRIVQREIDGASRPFCCLGCAFIAEQVALARSRLGRPVDLKLPDEEAAAAQQPARCQIEIRGMAGATCAALIEARLRATPGVAVADVDFAARRATVVHDRNRVARQALQQVIQRAGYQAVAGASPECERRARRIELLRLTVAWQATIGILLLTVPAYLAGAGEIGPRLQQLLWLGQTVLLLPMLLFSAMPLGRAAASQLRLGQIGMEVPVALGLVAALGVSLLSVATGRGVAFFDSIALVIALLLSVRWWQQRALIRASQHIDAAVERTMGRAQRLVDHPRSSEFEAVPADRLVVGDCVMVPVGALVPADGRVIEGNSAMSLAWLTGESAPLDAGPGARVPAGALNLEQPLVVETVRCGDRTSLSELQRLIVEAMGQRPRPVELADRVATRFVWALLAVSLGTALGWWMVDPSAALRNAVAVLIVTCPCALALATPLATAIAQAVLARRGVLVARASVLEQLPRVHSVAFAKSGTLTEPDPVVTGILAMGELDDADCLRMAASLQARSHHPFARALVRTARQAQLALAPVSSLTDVAGAGVEGLVEGRRVRFGKPDYALALAGDSAPLLDIVPALAAQCGQGGTGLILADQDGPLAIVRFGEQIRVGAAGLLAQLAHQGSDLMLVSGDRRCAVEAVAVALEGDANRQVYAEQTPAGKQALLARWQREGRRVAVIGDGINHAPLLAQADASIALASSSDVAQTRADVVCLGSNLSDVALVFDLARRTARAVRVNLACAVACSAVMAALAMAGRVSPLIALAGVAVSSAVVLVNSLWLAAHRPPAPSTVACT